MTAPYKSFGNIGVTENVRNGMDEMREAQMKARKKRLEEEEKEKKDKEFFSFWNGIILEKEKLALQRKNRARGFL